MVAYPPAVRKCLIALPIALITITVALSAHESASTYLNACYINRVLQEPPPSYIPLRDAALNDVSVFAIWAALLTLLLLPRRRIHAVYNLSYTSLWFHTTYILLAALKAPLSDFQCAGRHDRYPNGISGHYCYFLFVLLSTPFLLLDRIRSNPAPPPRRPTLAVPVALACVLTFVVGALATLFRTFAHGYHSPRQILLGSALGIASHAALERILLSHCHTAESGPPSGPGNVPPQSTTPSRTSPPAGPSRRTQIAILFACALSSYTLYEMLWPLNEAGPAITSGHKIFHAVAWVVVCTSAAIAERASTPKVAVA